MKDNFGNRAIDDVSDFKRRASPSWLPEATGLGQLRIWIVSPLVSASSNLLKIETGGLPAMC